MVNDTNNINYFQVIEKGPVTVGQIWKDNDKRREGRTFRIKSLEVDKAVCEVLTHTAGTPIKKKLVRIKLERFKPVNNNYTLIKESPFNTNTTTFTITNADDSLKYDIISNQLTKEEKFELKISAPPTEEELKIEKQCRHNADILLESFLEGKSASEAQAILEQENKLLNRFKYYTTSLFWEKINKNVIRAVEGDVSISIREYDSGCDVKVLVKNHTCYSKTFNEYVGAESIIEDVNLFMTNIVDDMLYLTSTD